MYIHCVDTGRWVVVGDMFFYHTSETSLWLWGFSSIWKGTVSDKAWLTLHLPLTFYPFPIPSYHLLLSFFFPPKSAPLPAQAAEGTFGKLVIKGKRLKVMWGKAQGSIPTPGHSSDAKLTPVPGLPPARELYWCWHGGCWLLAVTANSWLLLFSYTTYLLHHP